MAKNFTTERPTQFATDADYPLGKAQNITTAGDNTGTPWVADVIDDLILGPASAEMYEADLEPDGQEEKAGQSQRVNAKKIIAQDAMWGDKFVGTFKKGCTITAADQVVRGAPNVYWQWQGALPKVVNAGTVPSSPDYEQRTFNEASNVSTLNGGDVQGYINSNPSAFDIVEDLYTHDFSNTPNGTKINWMGYFVVGDGGSNWGWLRKGDSSSITDDAGSIFLIVNDNTDGVWIEANHRGSKVNCRKFGCMPNMDGTQAMLNCVSVAKDLGSIVYVPATMTIGDFYEVNAQLDLTACGMVGDGRDASRIRMNTGADDSILHRGDGALTLYTVLKGIYLRNNGSTGNAVSWDLAPRHNYMSDVKIYGWREGAAVVVRDSTWITDMDDVFLDNCKYGLLFERTQSIGNVGGSHTFRGGAIEGCERAIEGSVKNLAFYGTPIEGNQGIQETFANNDRVGGVCKLGVGEGPIAFHDCWFEGNGLPAIITGVGATSEASATAQVTVNGGRHEAEKLIWIMGVTSQISLRDLNFDRTAVARNAIIWVQNISSQGTSVHIENCRYRQDYQRIYDPYTFNYLPKTTMIHNGGRVLFPSNTNGDVFAGGQAQLKYERLDNVSLTLVLDDWVQGNGLQRSAY